MSDVRSLLKQLLVSGLSVQKWFIGYNFGLDDGAESKTGTHKELVAFKILKYKYCVNQSRDMPLDHFTENGKLLFDWWPV